MAEQDIVEEPMSRRDKWALAVAFCVIAGFGAKVYSDFSQSSSGERSKAKAGVEKTTSIRPVPAAPKVEHP